jgi:hypothetical protein
MKRWDDSTTSQCSSAVYRQFPNGIDIVIRMLTTISFQLCCFHRLMSALSQVLMSIYARPLADRRLVGDPRRLGSSTVCLQIPIRGITS